MRDKALLPIPHPVSRIPPYMADLDRYAEPRRDAATLAARRTALIDQLGWLEDEAAALAPLLADLPAWATDRAPMPGDLTAKETFAQLAAWDRGSTADWLRRALDEDAPDLSTPEPQAQPQANERDLGDLLSDLQAARADLRQRVEAVDPEAWSRRVVLDGAETDLYGLLLAVVQRDAEHLKEIAYRLHQADLRPRDAESELPRPPQA